MKPLRLYDCVDCCDVLLPAGRWTEVKPFMVPMPKSGCCYAFYDGDELVYIGSTKDMHRRFEGHGFRLGWGGISSKKWGPIRLRVKLRPSQKYGDWAMVEARLIRRYKPKYNTMGCDGRFVRA